MICGYGVGISVICTHQADQSSVAYEVIARDEGPYVEGSDGVEDDTAEAAGGDDESSAGAERGEITGVAALPSRLP
jgi:hypothetical protein